MAKENIAVARRFFPQVITEAQDRKIEDIARAFKVDERIVRAKLWLARREGIANLAKFPMEDAARNLYVSERLTDAFNATHEYALHMLRQQRPQRTRKAA